MTMVAPRVGAVKGVKVGMSQVFSPEGEKIPVTLVTTKGREASESPNAVLDMFKPGDKLDVRGTTKGHGFSGVVKRWNFQGGPGAHGSRLHRHGGSIGSHTYPKRVFKGRKMPGRYGCDKMTVLNVCVVDVLKDENMLVLKGSLPGAKRGILEIRKSKRLSKIFPKKSPEIHAKKSEVK